MLLANHVLRDNIDNLDHSFVKCPVRSVAANPTYSVFALLGKHELAKSLAIKKTQSLIGELAPSRLRK